MADSAASTVTVRPAEERDLPAIVRLNRIVQALHTEVEPGLFRPPEDLPGIEDFHRARLGQEGGYTLVAEVGGAVVGYVAALLQHREVHTFAWERRRLHVDQVGVDPAHRRHGVGRALMARMDALAAELDATEVTLDSWSFNEDAHRFFRAMGYAVYNYRFRKDTP